MSTRSQIAATLAAAAFTGLLAGTSHAATPVSAPAVTKTTSAKVESILGKQLAADATTAPAAKHACKGKNDCKGAGGCNTGDNGCKAKNSCKGKGGCSTEEKPATKNA